MSGLRLTALDWINFLLADVRGGLGPYVIVYLVTQAAWTQSEIGAVLSVSGLIGILAHPTVGAFIDRTHAKRALIIAGSFLLAACGLAILWAPLAPVVLAADIVMAVLGGVFAPAVAAMTVGLCSREELAARLGRNAAFDHAGNVFIAAFIGIIGLSIGQTAPFYLAPIFAAFTAIAVLRIPAGAIDHDKARGFADKNAQPRPEANGWRSLLAYRPLFIFAIASALFHFANAPLLLLVLQKLALANPGWETGLTSAALLVTQFTTILMALLVTRANKFGRRPLLIAAFLAVPLRAGLCAWFDDPWALLAVQIFDGIGGGLLETLVPLILADLMAGTGHYSLARGALGAIQGAGGASSQVAAGAIIAHFGFTAAFLTLAFAAFLALGLVVLAMPETNRTRPAGRAGGIR